MSRTRNGKVPRDSSERWMWEGKDFALGRIIVGADDPRWNERCVTGSEPALSFHATSWVVESPVVSPFVAGPNQVLFVGPDREYFRRRPPGLAECSDALWVSKRVRREVVGRYLPDVEERLDDPVPFAFGPRPARLALVHRALMGYVLREKAPDPLLVEETALHVYRESHRAAFAARGVRPEPRRADTRTAHRDAIRAAQQIVASSYRERLRLGEIARRVGLSPAHFSRVFRRETGMTVNDYVSGFRLAEALDRLPTARGDTTTLALELGFSSRSHFSDAFRGRFGVPPSEVATLLAKTSAAELRSLLPR